MFWLGSARKPSFYWTRVEDPETICRMFNIDATVLTMEWIRAYSAEGFASFGLKDYSEVSISLRAEQRAETEAICRRPQS